MNESELLNEDTGLLNIHELVLDLIIICFIALLNYFFMYRDFSVLTYTDSTGLAVLIVLIDVFVPMYLARLRANILANATILKKFISRLLGMIVISATVMLGFVLPILLYIKNRMEEGIMVVLLVVGIIAVILSAVSGDSSKKSEKTEKDNKDMPAYLGILWILCLAAIVIFGLSYSLSLFANGKVIFGILAIAGMIGGLIVVTYVFMEGAIRFEKIFASTVYKRYAEPSIVIIMVLLWQEIFYGLTTSGKQTSPAMNIVLLSLSGVLPVRLMTAFEPPLKPINLIIAVFTLGWAVYALYNR